LKLAEEIVAIHAKIQRWEAFRATWPALLAEEPVALVGF
jgi:hypothetical protein